VCGGRAQLCERFAPQPFQECERCGFIFRADFDAAALRDTYEQGAYEEIRGAHYLAELAHRRRDARVRLDYLGAWAGGGRLLDIGAAGGAFVAEAAARGFDASGIEPVPSFARAARERLGVDVRDGTIEQTELGDARYDAITMWHVLEHVPDPIPSLRRIALALRPGGLLALEVPNAASAVALHMGAGWTSLEPDVHVNQFGPTSLRIALTAVGLQLCDLRTSTITPYLPRRARLAGGHIAARLKAAVWLRDPRARHPTGHELLRAVARRSAPAATAAHDASAELSAAGSRRGS
jgi:SAM-dependent methyltransferase